MTESERMIAVPYSLFVELCAVVAKLAACKPVEVPAAASGAVPKLLTVKQLVSKLGDESISVTRLYDLAMQDKVPHVRVGSRLRFPEDRIERWIAAGCPADWRAS